MNINIYNQFFNLLIFIITGIVIGVLFDLFRIIRQSFKTSDLITYFEDILFWLLAGGILLFSIFTFNSGEIRSYIFAGLAIGIILYLLTVSKYFIKINVSIIVTLKKVISYPIKLIIKFVRRLIINPIANIFKKTKKIVKKLSKVPHKKVENNHFTKEYNKIRE